MPSKILVPVDGSTYSKKALEQAVSIAKGTGASVTAFHVIEKPPTVYVESQKVLNDAMAKYRSESARMLDECKAIAEGLGFKIGTAIMEGDPAAGIVAFCEKGGFDLIAMGSRGHSKLKEMVLGSTSHKVLHRARCSVLIVK
ncbi:universal stress protein [Nitrososphaera viennensis]|uniref:Universal stress protein n=1 Tax=Nitrososphaera viennensis TaxID=1034015 RepID=A0A977NNI4_9ARCH|nr:universal stress protein [Nitrososphaera viennensis]UVS69815.1 universal stress protein [Nitrososphaera viennensis]